MTDAPPPSLARTLLLWALLSVVFLAAGGLGAGVTALLYEWIVGDPFGDLLYAVIFGGVGLVAFRVAHHHVRAHRRAAGHDDARPA